MRCSDVRTGQGQVDDLERAVWSELELDVVVLTNRVSMSDAHKSRAHPGEVLVHERLRVLVN